MNSFTVSVSILSGYIYPFPVILGLTKTLHYLFRVKEYHDQTS